MHRNQTHLPVLGNRLQTSRSEGKFQSRQFIPSDWDKEDAVLHLGYGGWRWARRVHGRAGTRPRGQFRSSLPAAHGTAALTATSSASGCRPADGIITIGRLIGDRPRGPPRPARPIGERWE